MVWNGQVEIGRGESKCDPPNAPASFQSGVSRISTTCIGSPGNEVTMIICVESVVVIHGADVSRVALIPTSRHAGGVSSYFPVPYPAVYETRSGNITTPNLFLIPSGLVGRPLSLSRPRGDGNLNSVNEAKSSARLKSESL